MKALRRLYKSGLTRASVAAAIDSPAQLVGMYERGKRFPGRENFKKLNDLAESRGIVLLARDFLDPNGQEESE